MRSAQISTEICIKLFRQRSFSISLNNYFHQAILEPSLQTRFMFDIKKLFINALAFVSGETQDDLLRIAINLPEFCRIPKACRSHYRLQQSRKYSMTCNFALLHHLSLLLFRFVVFHYDMKLIYCGVLFLEGFRAKQQCSYPKITGKNDRQDESLTGQVHNQAGHCPLTGRY